MAQSLAGAQGTRRGTRQVKVAPEKETGTNPGDLQMTSAEMRDLTQKVADLVLDRYEGLPTEPAWEGEFRLELEDQLMEDPPEDGRSAEEVFERAARQILPIAARIDPPPPLLWFYPLVTYLAWNTCGFHGGRLPREPMHLADLQRSQPA